MGLSKPNEKKSIVQLVLKKNEKDVEVLGFAAKAKQTKDDPEPVLITSWSVLQTAEQHPENVFVQDYTPKTSLVFKSKKKTPLRKLTNIKLLENLAVSFATYEGSNKDDSFLYYRYSPKGAETLSAYVFDNQEIIELQFKKQEGSYELSNVSKEGFDVKKAKGAPVIYKFGGEINNVVVGVLGSNNNQDGDPVIFPVLFEEGVFKVGDENPRASGCDKTTGPSENEDDEKGDSNSDAATSETSNQQVNDGSGQRNVTYVVNIRGNPNFIAIGDNNQVNLSNNRAENAENNDQNAEGNDDGDRTDNVPVTVDDCGAEDVDDDVRTGEATNTSLVVLKSGTDMCQEVITMIKGQHDIKTVDHKVFAVAVVEFLQLDTTSLEHVPTEIMKNCRKLCAFLKQQQRLDIVRELKIRLPNGMTGPLGNEMTVFLELPVEDKKNLTEAISANEILWKKLLTELLGVSSSQIGYYERSEDPAEKIFAKLCRKRRLTVEEVYEILVRYGDPALADEYL